MNSIHKIGETLNFSGYPESKIIGVDHYRLVSLSGKKTSWFSYTLLSQNKPIPIRWWASEADNGFYCWSPTTADEVKGEIDLDRSGLCLLQSIGDTITASHYSTAIVYRDGNDIYGQEIFENEILYMKARLVQMDS